MLLLRGWLRTELVCTRQWRSLATSATDATATLLKEYEPGRQPPQAAPFELSPEQARQEFLRWQRRRAYLTPGNLLQHGTYHITASWLPFWLFSVRARVEYRGAVGQVDREGKIAWREVGWQALPPKDYPWTDPAMQVYASYRYRRDFAEVAKAGGDAVAALRPLSLDVARSGEWGPLPSSSADSRGEGAQAARLDPPAMRQAIAWEFVLRAIHAKEVFAAEQRLSEVTGGGSQHVRDVHVRVTPLARSARLAWLPAYVLDYIHGETFNVHGERKDEEFQAAVSGAVVGWVAGERHISPHKVSLAAGTLAVGAMAATGVVGPLLGMDPWSLLSLEGAFYAAATAWSAGLGARLLPLLARQREEEARVAAEDAEFDRVVSMGLGPQDPGTPEQEVLRSNAEWRRWEESDKANWNEYKRQRWAEELWRGQHRRRLERIRMAERLRREAERQEAEQQREERRQRRWGSSSQRHHFAGNVFAGGHKAGGRRDFLGYYRLLGLDGAPPGTVSQEDIKRAFRRAALQWHPDKHEGGKRDPAAAKQARQRFNDIRTAYDVLRDPERRRAYDNGQVVRP